MPHFAIDQLQKPSARERILWAAHDLFYRDGIRATGTNRIIQEARVTKVTFYRHFPSKNDLVIAFLEYRHTQWIDWFQEAVARYGDGVEALIPALREWFARDDFRGCAFINTVGEQGGVLPQVVNITRRHKEAMVGVIDSLLPNRAREAGLAQSLAVAVDGAIVWAQFVESERVLASLENLVSDMTG